MYAQGPPGCALRMAKKIMVRPATMSTACTQRRIVYVAILTECILFVSTMPWAGPQLHGSVPRTARHAPTKVRLLCLERSPVPARLIPLEGVPFVGLLPGMGLPVADRAVAQGDLWPVIQRDPVDTIVNQLLPPVEDGDALGVIQRLPG